MPMRQRTHVRGNPRRALAGLGLTLALAFALAACASAPAGEVACGLEHTLIGTVQGVGLASPIAARASLFRVL
jgi:hypothetical protein